MKITKTFIIKFSGVVLILIGVISLLVPVVPGWLLIFAGITLLFGHERHLDKIMRWLKRFFADDSFSCHPAHKVMCWVIAKAMKLFS